MADFQLYLQSGKQAKVGCVEDDSHVVFSKKKNMVKKEAYDGALS
jgi:hypothetical protein